ncbi:MAG: hypothetical protein ABWX65_09000, partial [Mycetocola sp.]
WQTSDMDKPEDVAARIEILELVQMIRPRIFEIVELLEPATSPADAVQRLAAGLNVSETAARQIMAQSLRMSLTGYHRAAMAAELAEIRNDVDSEGSTT